MKKARRQTAKNHRRGHDAASGTLKLAANWVNEVCLRIREAGEILDATARNDYTGRISPRQQANFAEVTNRRLEPMKNNVNACMDALSGVAAATNMTVDTLQKSMQSIGENAQALSDSSTQLASSSEQMSGKAAQTSAQANAVATATQQVSLNLSSVATGAEQMTSTVQSIASNASEAAAVAAQAVKCANGANAIVAKLGMSSAEIGQVIKVITTIAQQTNLLALNATIEAARAGETGKGFAVVANEVKELAKQTAKATEEISQKITAIQEDAKRAVESIGSIGSIINQINDISGTIATAVEQQSATTNEMSRNVQEAAHGSAEITRNIQGVAAAAEGITHGAQDTFQAAQHLAETATKLLSIVGRFKVSDSKQTREAIVKTQAARGAR
jgi:methyl-accepting chemotaxis protein